MNPSVGDLLSLVQQGGYLGLLLFAILALSRRWVVFGYQLSDSEARVQEWKNLALSNMRTSERTLDIADDLKGVIREALQEVRADDGVPPPPPRRRRVR